MHSHIEFSIQRPPTYPSPNPLQNDAHFELLHDAYPTENEQKMYTAKVMVKNEILMFITTIFEKYILFHLKWQ